MSLTMDSIFRSDQDEFLIGQEQDDSRQKIVVKSSTTYRHDYPTVTADPDLVLKVYSDTTYSFKANIIASGDSTTPDLDFKMIAPTGAQGTWQFYEDGVLFSTIFSMTNGRTNFQLTTSNSHITIVGTFSNVKTGTIAFAWAQANSDADDTRISATSSLEVYKI